MNRSLRDAMAALSLSNLCFISAWQILLNPGHYFYYYWKNYPGFTEIIALVLDILLLAVLFSVGIAATRRFGKGALAKGARVLFVLLLVIPLNSIRLGGGSLNDLDLFTFLRRTQVMVLGCLLLAAILLVLWRWSSVITRIVAPILMILAPFSLVALSQGVWLAQRHRSDIRLFNKKTPDVAESETEPARRVLWLIFDEMDQRMLFDARPDGIKFPELDRFRSEAIYADSAYPPAGETLMSMPALTTGRIVTRAVPSRPDELMLTFDGSKEAAGWSAQPNIFSAARAAGFRTALIGWYHPYCRTIGTGLDVCYWEPSISEANPVLDKLSMGGAMRLWVRAVLFRIPLVFRLLKSRYMRDLREQHIVTHQRILAEARAVVRDRGLNLTLIHFPVPHHPFIYDPARNVLSPATDNDYAGNLELVDKILGELRREMEAAFSWNKTAVLITSDHWWRDSTPVNGRRDHRVPFLLKLAGQPEGVTYPRAFNTVLTHDLVLAYLSGELSSKDDMIQWMDRHRSFAESPFTKNLP